MGYVLGGFIAVVVMLFVGQVGEDVSWRIFGGR